VCLLVEAAYRAAATDFLLLRQKKVSKEKATLLSASLWALLRKSQAGNLRCSPAGCAAELATRLQRFAQTTASSQMTKHVRPSAHMPSRRLCASAQVEGVYRDISSCNRKNNLFSCFNTFSNFIHSVNIAL